jgi:hypothetical protein
VLTELRSLHEKEKSLLMEENKKLSAELEKSLEVLDPFFSKNVDRRINKSGLVPTMGCLLGEHETAVR